MNDCNNSEKNTISVCLFDSEQKDADSLKEEKIFGAKLREIYNKDHEEIFIATSPSFSPVAEKPDIDELCCQQKSKDLINAKTDKDIKLAQKNLPASNVSSCVSNDSHSVEYETVKSVASYSTANNDDGQGYFITSDYSQLGNLGIEVSKTFFYVLSPMDSTNSLINSTRDQSSFHEVDGGDLMHAINDGEKTLRKEGNKAKHKLSSTSSSDEKIVAEREVSLSEFEQEAEHIDLAQTEIDASGESSTVQSDFDHLSSDFNVNFIHGIPDSVDSPDSKDRSQLVWQQLPATDHEQKKQNDEPTLFMKYEHNSKMDMPTILHGQPYLQVALVSDMEPSSTSELVSTDQILGVAVPEIFICKWEGCGSHFLTNNDLVKHVNTEHINADSKQMYTCYWKGCVREGKSFDARYKILIHLRTHTGEKPHLCPVTGCQASFSRIENLKIHVRTHTGEKPYPCQHEGCHKTFANSSDRFKHKRTHEEKKPYRCTVKGCDKCYTDPSSLRKHRKRHAARMVTT